MKKIVSRFALLQVLCTRIIPLLLFSALVRAQSISLAAANPIYDDPSTPEPDKNPPTISILSPENKTYTVNKVSLAFDVSEHISWASYSLDGQANVTIRNIPLVHGIGTFGNITLIGLTDGTHSLTVYAKDTAGNTGASETIYFLVEQETEPVFLGTSLPTEYKFAIVTVIGVAIAAAAGNQFFKRLRQRKQPSTVLKGE